MGELKELQTKIGREIKKKEKADKEMEKLRRDLMNKAYEKLRDERIFSTGVFEFRDKRHGEGSLKAWVHDFKGMAEIMEAYNTFHGRAIYLTPVEFEATYNVHHSIRIVPLHGDLELYIGEDVSLEYLKAVAKEYGLRVNVRSMNKYVKKNQYSKYAKLHEKLILSGMAEGLPLCEILGFENEYLEIEEQYARMLHQAFKKSAADMELKAHRELQQDFDLLDLQSGVALFLAMGRSVFKEIRGHDGGEEDEGSG